MQEASRDDRLRAAALAYVAQLEERGDGFVRSRDLRAFRFEGQTTPLLAQMKGIRVLPDSDVAITIMTAFSARPQDRPYEDDVGHDGYPRYKRMRGNPEARENRALRTAMTLGKPLIWFYGVGPAVYRAHRVGLSMKKMSLISSSSRLQTTCVSNGRRTSFTLPTNY